MMRKILFATVAIVACAGAGNVMAEHGQRGHGGLFAAADSDHDGALTRQEFDAGREALFTRMDADSDGQLTRGDHRRHRGGDGERGGNLSRRHPDSNNDGAISRDEFLARPLAMFARLDANNDGSISAEERSHRGRRAEGLSQGERRRADSNRDHQISTAEFISSGAYLFERLDSNADGRVTPEEFAQRRRHGRE